MRELTFDDLSMRELTADEIDHVSGGWTTVGAAFTLAGTLVAIGGVIAGAIVGAPLFVTIAGSAAILAAGLAGFAYAYDAISEVVQHLPTGTVTVEDLIPTDTPVPHGDPTIDPTTSTLGTSTTTQPLVSTDSADMGEIGLVDMADFGGGS